MERKRTKINEEEEFPLKLPVMVFPSMSYLLIIIHLRKITKVEFKLERSKRYENLKDRCVKLIWLRDIYITNWFKFLNDLVFKRSYEIEYPLINSNSAMR